MAYLATIYGVTLTIIGVLLSFQGLWLTSRALWPNRVQAAAARCRRNAIASFFLGVPLSAATFVLAGICFKFGTKGQVAGWGIISMWLIYANVGVAGLATHMGQRLASPIDTDRPWRATVRGGIVLELAWLTPVLGWFVLLSLSMVTGVGATTLSFFRPRIDSLSPPGQTGIRPPTPFTSPYTVPFSPMAYPPNAYAPSEAQHHPAAQRMEPAEVGR